jgi:aspartyl-tRNA(Asn)/glutamyl-tRNA(Gln) amidotransferase subunit C
MNQKKKLSIKDTQHIAELARIDLNQDEENKFTDQLNNILEYFEKLGELDEELKDVDPFTHPTKLVNVFREDKVKPSLPIKDALKNAPRKEKGFFKAPKII